MSFTLDLSKAIKNIKEEAVRVVQGTLFGVSSRIIKATPVGNPTLWIFNRGTEEKPNFVDFIAFKGAPEGYVGGSLRGAWVATIGESSDVPSGVVDANGSGTINSMSSVVTGMKIGQNFFLSNALPYALRVEMGWSTQAPQGMVRRAVLATQQVIDKVAR